MKVNQRSLALLAASMGAMLAGQRIDARSYDRTEHLACQSHGFAGASRSKRGSHKQVARKQRTRRRK